MLNKSSTRGSSSSEEPPKRVARYYGNKSGTREHPYFDRGIDKHKSFDFTYVLIDHQSHFDK